MILNFEVLASSSIKRKKPWPQFVWLGKDPGSLFLLDSNRVSQLYLPSGKTRKRIPSLQSVVTEAQVLTASANGHYLAGALNSGKVFIWHKDTESVKFTAVLDRIRNAPPKRIKHIKVYVSDEGTRVLVCAGNNGIFLWESDQYHNVNGNPQLSGTWVQIQHGENQLPGEEDKEAAADCVFYSDPVCGACATVSWVFNQGNKIHVTILHLKWHSDTVEGCMGDLPASKGPSLSPQWRSTSQPLAGLVLAERVIKSRRAYVCRLAPDGQVLAVALNQKCAAHTRLLFCSPCCSAAALLSDLKGCGANIRQQNPPMGRIWWIVDMAWTRDGVLLVCITKRGSVAVVTKLGEPVQISTSGCSMDMEPALFLPLHPRINFQKHQGNVSADHSESSMSERNPMSQKFSVTVHPTLPLLVVSDGYAVTVLQLPPVACCAGVVAALTEDVCSLIPGIKVQPISQSRFPSSSRINIAQFEGSSFRRMSAEFLDDRASESDSMSSTGFLSGFGLASGEQGVGFYGLESRYEPSAPVPGSPAALLRAQNVSLMALGLGCACSASWDERTARALGTSVDAVMEILRILLETRGAEDTRAQPALSPKATRRAAGNGVHARLREAFAFFRMLMDLFRWDACYKNMFPRAVRLAQGLVRELLSAEIPDVLKIRSCVDVLAWCERVLRRVYGSGSDTDGFVSEAVDQLGGGGTEPTAKRQGSGESRVQHETRATSSEGRSEDLPEDAEMMGDTGAREMEREFQDGSAARQGETRREGASDRGTEEGGVCPQSALGRNQVGVYLSGAWLQLYRYTCKSRRKLFTRKAGHSLQSVREGRRGSQAEKQLVMLLCRIQEKLQEFGAKIPAHTTVQKEIMREMKVGALSGSPSMISLPDPSKQDSLFSRKREAQASNMASDGLPKSVPNSPVLLAPSTGGGVSTRRSARSLERSSIGRELFSQAEQDQQTLLSILYLHLGEYNLKSALEVVYSLIEPAGSFERMVVQLNASFAPSAPSAFLAASRDLGPKKLLRVLLHDYPLARVSERCGIPVVQTLARLMAAYFSNLPLYTYPPDRPLPLPAFYFGHAAVLGPAELETLRLTHPVDVQPLDRTQVARAVREQNLDDLWSASSALELMLVSGLLSEAAWLARNLGDWKNAFLLSFADGVLQEPDVPADVLTSFPRNPDCLKPETLALSKLGPVLWDEFCKEVSGDREPALRRKWSFQSLQDPDEQEVHLDSRSVGAVARVVQASLVAGLDLVPVILAGLVDALRAAVGRLEWVVPAGFYLPAPPLYCPQPPDEKKDSLPVSVQKECAVRSEAALLIRRILQLLFGSNCAQACVRWYCERLVYAAEAWHEGDGEADVPCALVTHATQGFDFGSAGMRTPVTPSKRKGAADPSRSAKSRLSGVERGPLPDSIASVVQAFRQLCVLMWVLHARDKTSLFSRKYRRLHSQDAETTEQNASLSCMETLLWTARLVPFSSLLDASGEIHDALLTILSDMQPGLDSVDVAAQFFGDPDVIDTTAGKAKLKRLIARFRGMTLGEAHGMEGATADQPVSGLFRQKCSEWRKRVARRERIFGQAPKQPFSRDEEATAWGGTSVGANDFETHAAYLKFLDTFFLVTFTKAVNQQKSPPDAPLLLPFAKALVASDVAALAKLKSKAGAEGSAKSAPSSRLVRSQSFTDVRTSKPSPATELSQLRKPNKPAVDIKRSSSLGDVTKIGGMSGMETLGKEIVESLPKLVWLSRWSTESSPSQTRFGLVGTSEGRATMRVNVPLPLVVNCLWLLRNVYSAWASNTEVRVDITVQRGDLLLNVTETNTHGKEETPHRSRPARGKPKKLERLYGLAKAHSEPNIPQIVVLSPTTEEEEALASLALRGGRYSTRRKTGTDGNAAGDPIRPYSDSECAFSSKLGKDNREPLTKRRARPSSSPPRARPQPSVHSEDLRRRRAPKKQGKENRPASVPSSPNSDSFRRAAKLPKKKRRTPPKERPRTRGQWMEAAADATETSAVASQDTSNAAGWSSSDSSSYPPPPPLSAALSESRRSHSDAQRSQLREMSLVSSDLVSSRASVPSGDMEVFLVLRPREGEGPNKSGLPVLRMPAVVESGQLASEHGATQARHSRTNAASQTEPSRELKQTQTAFPEIDGGGFHRSQDVLPPHRQLSERVTKRLGQNAFCSSQTQTDPAPEYPIHIRELDTLPSTTGSYRNDGGGADRSAGDFLKRSPRSSLCSAQTQTDDPSPVGTHPVPLASQQDSKAKLAWLPSGEERVPRPALGAPFGLLSLPGKQTNTNNKTLPTSPRGGPPLLLNGTDQSQTSAGHVAKPNFSEFTVQRSTPPLLRMHRSEPAASRPGLDLSKVKLLDMTSRPAKWQPLRMPEKETPATGRNKLRFFEIQPRVCNPGQPLLRKPESQRPIPDLVKVELLRNLQPEPVHASQKPVHATHMPLLESQTKSGPPQLLSLKRLLAFEKRRANSEKRNRDSDRLGSEKENFRPSAKEAPGSHTGESQEDSSETRPAPKLIRVKGHRWKERTEEKNSAARQRRRQKQANNEERAKEADAPEHRSEPPHKKSKVIIVKPAQKEKKRKDEKSEPAKQSSRTRKKGPVKPEGKEAPLSDESELVLSDISDFEVSSDEEQYFRVERSPAALRSPELEEDVLREYKNAVRSLPSEAPSKGETAQRGVQRQSPRPLPRTRGRDTATQPPKPARLAESIGRRLQQIDSGIQQRTKPVVHEKSVSARFEDATRPHPAVGDYKAVGVQVDAAEGIINEGSRKPTLRDASVATGVAEEKRVETSSVGAQTDELETRTERRPQSHAPVLPPDIFLNLKFPKLDASPLNAEMDAESSDGAHEGAASAVVPPKRQFVSVAEMDSKLWSEIQAAPNPADASPAQTRRTPGVLPSEDRIGEVGDDRQQRESDLVEEDTSLPGIPAAPGGRRTPEETPTQQLDLSNHGGPDAVTVGVLDSLDSTKPHRFARPSLSAESLPNARTISRQRLSQRMEEMTDQLNAIERISQNMEREFQSSTVLLKAIESIGQVMSPEQSSPAGHGYSANGRRPRAKLWSGVVPRRPAASSTDEQKQPQETAANGVDQPTDADDDVGKSQTSLNSPAASDRSGPPSSRESGAGSDSGSPPSSRKSGAGSVSEHDEPSQDASEAGGVSEIELETLEPEPAHSTGAATASVHTEPPLTGHDVKNYPGKVVGLEPDPRLSTTSEGREDQERRKELKAWMVKKRTEQHARWKSELDDTRHKEYKPYVVATQGSTFKKIKLAEKERGEKRREREGEHLSERMKEASSLLTEMLAEKMPKPKEQPNMRYKPVATPQNRASLGKKNKANQRYGKQTTARRQTRQKRTSERQTKDASDHTAFGLQTSRSSQRDGGTAERLRVSREEYVTTRSGDHWRSSVVDVDVDDHVTGRVMTPDEDYWRSSSPSGAEFVTNAAYRRHQKEKSRRSQEREALFLEVEQARSRPQGLSTRALPRPGTQDLTAMSDIDHLLDNISADGSTLNEENIENLIDEDDELRDLLGDVLGRGSASGIHGALRSAPLPSGTFTRGGGPAPVHGSATLWNSAGVAREPDSAAHLLAETREAVGDDLSESSGSIMSNIDWAAVDRIMNDV